MKITAHYNPTGVILAAAVVDEDTYNKPVVVPKASKGNKVGVFDVPETMSRRPLNEICQSLRVDAKSQRLVEGKQPSTRGGAKSR
jgi:hypothetical protein